MESMPEGLSGAWCQTWVERGDDAMPCSARLDCGLCCHEHPDHDAATCANAFCVAERDA